ncbi:SNF1-interacting protein, partial [Coemansia sp. RSA 2603]
MGNAAGKLNGATVCDGGNLEPNGIYAADAQDFDAKVVQRLILARQLAPFYVGADDPDPDPDVHASDDPQQPGQPKQPAHSDDGWWSYSMMLAQHEQQQLEKLAMGANERGSASHSRQESAGSSVSSLLDAGS